ncbi:MAG: arsenite S-adenosylmethyltransferase, partial [Thermonemataceae bacterium]|nr:arsenite S-adenosylmethyltransferase [Thermonemataceae bacterium]
GGHFSISDIVFQGAMPQGVLEASEMHAGCVAGASEKGQYLGIIKKAGFKNIQIKKERLIKLPDELLLKYISQEELEDYKKSGSGIYSITLYAEKLEEGNCCDTTDSACCTSETDKNTTEKTSCCGTTSNENSSCCE